MEIPTHAVLTPCKALVWITSDFERDGHIRTVKHRHGKRVAEGHTENLCQSRTSNQLPNPGDFSAVVFYPQTTPLCKDRKGHQHHVWVGQTMETLL